MIVVKTSGLSGSALDYAVAIAEGWKFVEGHAAIRRAIEGSVHSDYRDLRQRWEYEYEDNNHYSPSADWSQGGPMIEKYAIILDRTHDRKEWSACFDESSINDGPVVEMCGPSPLVAACRAIVGAILGESVHIPSELMP